AGHLCAAQVEVAVAQAQRLVDILRLVEGEGRRLGLVEDGDAGGEDLDLAGGQVGIDGVGIAAADPALDGDDPFGTQVVRDLVVGIFLGVEDELYEAAGV